METTESPLAEDSGIGARIDRQIDFLHRARAVIPRLGEELASQKEFEAPEYYRQQLGYDVKVQLSEPMSKEFIAGMFEVAHWVNENFVIRLNAVLEEGRVVGKGIKKRKNLPGWDEVEIVLILRNQIAHGSPYDPSNPDHLSLYTRIVTHFDIAADYSYLEVEKYPLGIAAVLVPLAEGCKKYAAAIEANKAGPPGSGATGQAVG